MPLAQNYKDDVSLLESEATLAKTAGNTAGTSFGAYQGSHAIMSVSVNVDSVFQWLLDCMRVVCRFQVSFINAATGVAFTATPEARGRRFDCNGTRERENGCFVEYVARSMFESFPANN